MYDAPCSEIASLLISDCSEQLITAAISREAKDIPSISWARLAEETKRDEVLSKLRVAIEEDFSKSYTEITVYIRYKDSL